MTERKKNDVVYRGIKDYNKIINTHTHSLYLYTRHYVPKTFVFTHTKGHKLKYCILLLAELLYVYITSLCLFVLRPFTFIYYTYPGSPGSEIIIIIKKKYKSIYLFYRIVVTIIIITSHSRVVFYTWKRQFFFFFI